MFEFDVPLWQWILSQVIAVINLGLVFFAFQVKNKTRTLLIFAFVLFLGVWMNVLLENYVPAGMLGVSALRNVAYAWLERRREVWKKASVVILFAFILLSAGSLYFTFTGHWFDFVIGGGIILVTYTSWARGIHRIRFGQIIMSCIWIVNSVMFQNYIQIITDIIIIGSIILFYVRYLRAKEKIKVAPLEMCCGM
ncbi:MAG: YgjV family protein [Firmicutes bacterium]|nr:YgjV family protein [Bacillota bacterium]